METVSVKGLMTYLKSSIRWYATGNTLSDSRWCPSKPDPPDLLRGSIWCLAITRLEASSRLTPHYLESSDPPGHGNTGDWCSGAGSWHRQIVLASNRNDWMLRLIASRHGWVDYD